jgi:hypothetical protein
MQIVFASKGGHRGPPLQELLFSLSAIPIVLLSVDAPARTILSVLKPGSFTSRHLPVGFCFRFQTPGARLLSFHPRGFASRERAAPHALMNSSLLSALAPIYTWRLLRRHADPQRKHKHDR